MELPHHKQFQDMIHFILHIFFTIIYAYLSITIFYIFIVSIAGFFNRRKSYAINPDKKRIAVLITSYKEDNIIINTIKQATTHNYPEAFYKVFLAADHLQPGTIFELRKFNATIVSLINEKSSKARSLNNLLNSIDEEQFDIAIILDGDNIMMPGFMEKINAAFQNGYRAVQGHRTAKNKNSAVAVLDALSEEVNNHLFRKAQRALGFS
ncbi:MAG: glycosyltransferase, partial [Flavitalea sp.]